MFERFADADDRDQARGARGDRLLADRLVDLAVVLPALGVAEDHVGGAAVAEHGGRKDAGVSAVGLHVAVLGPDGDPGAVEHAGDAGEHGCGRADEQRGAGGRRGVKERAGERVGLGGEAVHLPVADDKLRHAGSV